MILEPPSLNLFIDYWVLHCSIADTAQERPQPQRHARFEFERHNQHYLNAEKRKCIKGAGMDPIADGYDFEHIIYRLI